MDLELTVLLFELHWWWFLGRGSLSLPLPSLLYTVSSRDELLEYIRITIIGQQR
jgi:hypothetical protein